MSGMRDVSCFLIKYEIEPDEIGTQKKKLVKKEVPIIKIKDVFYSEYYTAYSEGLSPSIVIVISAFNYDEEVELEYNGKRYTVIRTKAPFIDEVELICQRKNKNYGE